MGCVSTSSQGKQQKYKTPKDKESSIQFPNSSKSTNNDIASIHIKERNVELDSQKRQQNQTNEGSFNSVANTTMKINNCDTKPYLKSIKSINITQLLQIKKSSQIQIKSSTKNFIVDKQNIDINYRYEFHDIIGEGSNGKVYKAIQLSTGKIVAVKSIKNIQKNKSQMDKIQSEINILKKINHPNLIKTLDVILNKEMTYIVTEYYTGCTLNKVIEKSQKFNVFFSENQISIILKQILSALSYLHDKQIIHRDLKPENIIFANNEYNQIKIIDLGFAIYKKELLTSNSILGTPYYLAPEIITEETTQDEKSDIWSVGVVLYEMLTNQKPVKGDSMDQLFQNLLEKSINFETQIFPQYSQKLIDLLKKMLNRNSQARISARKALADVFFQDSSKQFIRKKLMINLIQFYQQNSELNCLQEILANYICQYIIDYKFLYEKKIIHTYQALASKTSNSICQHKLKKAIIHALQDESEEVNDTLKLIQLDQNKINFSTFTRKSIKLDRILSVENISACFKMLDFDNKNCLKSQFLKNFFQQNIKNQNEGRVFTQKQSEILQKENISQQDFINLLL